MSAVVFDKLDALFLFLPEFEVSVYGCSDQEFCPIYHGRLELVGRSSRLEYE